MARSTNIARGTAPAALVLLLLAACAPPDSPSAPSPRSLAAAESALRNGNLDRFAAELAIGPGLATRGSELAARLDPPAWLIAMGADTREHDLVAAMTAMRAGDDDSLARALGFGQQDLAATIFNAGASVYARRAGGRNYYESGPQPLDLLSGFKSPELPEGALALAVTLWGTVEDRQFKVDYTLGPEGVVNLDGTLWQAGTSLDLPERPTRHSEPGLVLPAAAQMLDVAGLVAPRFWGAKFRLVFANGAMQRIELGRDDKGWVLIDYTNTLLRERLGALRDERLEFIRRRASDFRRTSGRWPRGLHELTFVPSQLADPTSDSGRLGWSDLDAKPVVGFELAADDKSAFAVACKQPGKDGRRAISSDGKLFWLEP